MVTKTGTNHFTSEKAARWYYARQGLDAYEVSDMVATGAIAVGKPDTAKGTKAVADHEGRYWIIEKGTNK